MDFHACAGQCVVDSLYVIVSNCTSHRIAEFCAARRFVVDRPVLPSVRTTKQWRDLSVRDGTTKKSQAAATDMWLAIMRV